MLAPLREHFAGKTLLVTGATGFLAKALVAKVLRDLPEVGRVLLLLRPRPVRGGRTVRAAERLEREVLRSSAFRAERARLGVDFEAETSRLITAVEGDLGSEGLGLDARGRELVDGVDLVLNSAASVAFDERIDHALAVNALGPLQLLALTKELGCPFLHVSTAYTCGRRSNLVAEEAPAPGRSVADDLAGRSEGSLDLDELLADLGEQAQRMLADGRGPEALVALGMERAHELGWHDTYTFTKAIGERLLVRRRGDVRLGILRPAIIESAAREPEPGWIDGLRMGDPLFAAYGRGVLRKFPADPRAIVDFVPVDHVVNAALAASASLENAELPAGSPVPVWHVATSGDNPLVFEKLFESTRAYFREHPLFDRSGRPVRPVDWGFATDREFEARHGRQRVALKLSSSLASLLPGLSGRRWRRRLDRKRARLDHLEYYARIYRPYCSFRARFSTERSRELLETLCPEDRLGFDFDARTLSWDHYLREVHLPGLRRNVLRDGARPPLAEAAASDDGEFERPHGLFDLVQASADEHDRRPALRVTRDGRLLSWSHKELRSAALRAAARLRAQGIEAGDRVILQAESCPEWAIAYFGILAAGGVAVPLDQQTSGVRRAEIVNYTGARASVLSELVAGEGLEEGETALVLRDLCAAGESPSTEGLPLPRGGEDPASILFTSGTTLEPKGVVLAHRAFLANVDSVARALQPGTSDRLVSVLPLHHAFEFTAGLLAPLSQGASITYLESLSGEVLAQTLRSTRATCLLGVPRLFELLLAGMRRGVDESPAPVRGLLKALWSLARRQHAHGRSWGRFLLFPLHARFGGRLAFMVSGGAALPAEVQEEYDVLGFRLLQGYGLTETAPVLSVNPMDRRLPGSVGLPLPGVDIRIDEPGADGVGEILARGANLMSGYYRDPEATRAVLRDGWFRTGDLGRLDEDGFLHVTGRLKDLIVTQSGKNVYPDEVEAAVMELPGVRELCVVGAPSRDGSGEDVALVVVPERDDDDSLNAIREAVTELMEDLPSHQRVSRVHFTNEELPRTRLQKVQRSRVRARLGAPPAREATGPRAESGGHPRAERVLELLARLTGVEAASLTEGQDLLLDLGVDSLMAAELLAAADALTEDGVPLPEAADVKTVGELLALARRDGGAPVRPQATNAHANGAPSPATRLLAGTTAPLVRATWPLLYGGYLGLDVEGLDSLPKGRPYILAANHASHLDAGAVLTALGPLARDLRVVVARDYFFDTPLKARFFGRLLNAIPFDRHGDWEAGLAGCREALEAGHPLLIFPEGTRSPTGRLQEFKAGVGRLALEMQVPIVPTRIDGTHAALPKGRTLPRRHRLRVSFGEALDPCSLGTAEDTLDYERWRLVVEAVRDDIAGLKRPAATA
jgi:long-chain acyl-CoA synthetase